MIKFNMSDNLKEKIELLDNSYSVRTKNKIENLLSENYRLVWQTKGSSIGSPWGTNNKGETIDLYDTGRLYSDMIGVRYANITPSYITISAGQSYTSYLNSRYVFMTVSDPILQEIALVYLEPIKEVLR